MDALEIFWTVFALIVCPPSLYWWIQDDREKARKHLERMRGK